jgi:hypothetical protein
VAADGHPAEPQTLHAVFELLGGEVGMLQSHRRHRNEAIGMCGHPLGQPLVLRPHDRARQVAVGTVPPVGVDRQGLHVHALGVHRLEPCGPEDVVAAARRRGSEGRALDHLGDLRNDAVRMDVDHPHAASADGDLPSGSRALRQTRARAAKRAQTRGCSSHRAHELSPVRHQAPRVVHQRAAAS